MALLKLPMDEWTVSIAIMALTFVIKFIGFRRDVGKLIKGVVPARFSA